MPLPPCVAVLVPPLRTDRVGVPPEDLPVGRAALALERDGAPIVFADRVAGGLAWGQRATPGGWAPAEGHPVCAAYDRFPAETRPEAHAALLAGLDGRPVANAPAVVALCRDKLATQRALEAAGVPMPPVEADPDRFSAALAAWGAAFHKPRFGALGRDVRRVVPGDALPATLSAARAGATEPALLQRAVAPPRGFAGLCLRALVQRDADRGTLAAVEPVARTSRTDPVVNVARGADAAPASAVLPDDVRGAVIALAERAARALAEAAPGPLVEVGIDIVLDPDGAPWVIEANGRPQGRLEALIAGDADRWRAAHLEACARPLRWLVRSFLR